MMRYVKASHDALFALAVIAASTGCRLEAADEFRKGVPRPETVRMKVPEAAGQAQTVETDAQALLGDTAEFYRLTRDVSRLVNGAGFFILALVRNVTFYPPTLLAEDRAVWGPWSDPLDPIEYKVTVIRAGDHLYDYKVEGRDKHDKAANFVAFLTGRHDASVDGDGEPIEGFGAGTFTLDWDARATLPMPNPDEVGAITYVYSRTAPDQIVEVTAQFRRVKDKDAGGAIVDVDYGYAQQPNGPGRMDLAYTSKGTPTAPAGRWAVRSRWLSDGAGRSDVRAINAEVPDGAALSQCWDVYYRATYLIASWDANVGYGDAASCAFPTADHPGL